MTLPKAPRYLGSLVAKLRTDRDGLETAAAFLTQLAAETDDEYSRAEYLKSLDEVQTERMARLLDEARRRYRERNGRDIGRVEDLLRGPAPVLRALPPAHPLFPGFVWELDPETGVIQSSFYRARYAPHGHERRTHWLRENAVEGGA